MSIVSFRFNSSIAEQIIKQSGKHAIDLCLLDLQNKSVNMAPVDTGDLRASIVPDSDFTETPTHISKTLGTDLPYALKQHENLTYNHPKGGQAKYLEKPFDDNAQKYVNFIKQKIKNDLNSYQ